MYPPNAPGLRVAILDLYAGAENQGMRGIRSILHEFAQAHRLELILDEFEVRLSGQVPDLTYDIYLSTGGPGSPLESEGTEWEEKYFGWLTGMEMWNKDSLRERKKYAFFICHSFQLVCRHWQLGKVCPRRSTSFGIFPVHLLPEGRKEPVFDQMNDPFYAVDSRDFQVIEPRKSAQGSYPQILCIEKERPHVPLERAVMAIRFSDYFLGTQFHPEADPQGMSMYLRRPDKKESIIENHGEAKWAAMVHQLNDPDKIRWTYSHILPNFLVLALQAIEHTPV